MGFKVYGFGLRVKGLGFKACCSLSQLLGLALSPWEIERLAEGFVKSQDVHSCCQRSSSANLDCNGADCVEVQLHGVPDNHGRHLAGV